MLALLVLGMAVQDLTGWPAGRHANLVLMGHSKADADVLRFKRPDGFPGDVQLQRQTRLWQDGRWLQGPYRSGTLMRDAGEGAFSFGNVIFVRPFGDATAAEQASFNVWIPRGIPSAVRWSVYGFAAIFLLLPATRRRWGLPAAEAKKLRHLEAVRGLACFTVILFHFTEAFYPVLGKEDMQGRAWNDPERLYEVTPFANLLHAGPAAVNIYFLLSGLVFYLPYCGGAARDPARLRVAFVKRPVRLWGVMAAVMLAVQLLNLGGWSFAAFHSAP